MPTTYYAGMIHLGQFADIDTNENNYAPEDASALNGFVSTWDGVPRQNKLTYYPNLRFDDANDDWLIWDDDYPNLSLNEPMVYDLGTGFTVARIDSTFVVYASITLSDGTVTEMYAGAIQNDKGELFSSTIEITGRSTI